MKSSRSRSTPGRLPHSTPSTLHVHVVSPAEVTRFDALLAQKHYLGVAPAIGDFLRQVVLRDGLWVALLVWGPAALKLKDRERWIGWHLTHQVERLKLVVQNRRYLLLHDKGAEPNLASQSLAAACRALPPQWQERFGYRPLIAESFTDLEAYAGTCYKASGWEPVGWSAGHRRHRADYYQPGERPKKLWLKELAPPRPRHGPIAAVAARLRGGGGGRAARVVAAVDRRAAQFVRGAVAGTRPARAQLPFSHRAAVDDRGDGAAGRGAPDQ